MHLQQEGRGRGKVNGWTEGIQNAIQYIEDNLTEETDIAKIAARAHVSPFYFQKIFGVLCGFTVGEYIRNRRLALAAEELSTSDIKVIDAAVKYGYDSPDSFARAFTKFHGITPSAAKEYGAKIRSFAPIRIKLTLEGGTIMDYKIVEKSAFTVMGRSRRFDAETSYSEIPKYWSEHYANGGADIVGGMFGVCVDGDGKSFDYIIADLYQPWKKIPDGCETRVIPAGLWAEFPWKGKCPKALQDVNTKMWGEWLPNCKEYELAGNYSVEVYFSETEGAIWLPVKKK